MKKLTPRRLTWLARRVVEDCLAARARGYRVVKFEFHRPAKDRAKARCCPITAVAMASDPGGDWGSDSFDIMDRAARRLGLTETLTWGLVEGVDDTRYQQGLTPARVVLREVGHRVRRQLGLR